MHIDMSMKQLYSRRRIAKTFVFHAYYAWTNVCVRMLLFVWLLCFYFHGIAWLSKYKTVRIMFSVRQLKLHFAGLRFFSFHLDHCNFGQIWVNCHFFFILSEDRKLVICVPLQNSIGTHTTCRSAVHKTGRLLRNNQIRMHTLFYWCNGRN